MTMNSFSAPAPARHAPSIAALALSALAAVLGCASGREDSADRINDLVKHGRYDEAVRQAAALHSDRPGDARAEALHREATVAYLLEQGRRLTLADHDDEALARFYEAQSADPASREVASWIDKTKRKIADRWLGIGLEAHANANLEAAMDAYQNSLKYVPGDQSAVSGLASAVLQSNYRLGLGNTYFKEGLQALSQYWLDQARSRFANSKKYLPEDSRTQQRQKQVDTLLADQRASVGEQLESIMHFAAARNEYRLALALNPDNERAKAGLERTTKEAEAAELVRGAKSATMRNKFDEANALLDKGLALTTAQRELFDGARADVEQAVFEKAYQDALALERDFQYEEAVQAYAALLTKTPYYKDVLTRKDTLEQYLRLAGELYAKYQAAGSDAEKLGYLRQIAVFWPEYLDVHAELERLEKAAN